MESDLDAELQPMVSPATQAAVSRSKQPLLTKKRERELWVQLTLPDEIKAELGQPFGKPSMLHAICSEVCFCHVLLPLHKTKFMSCQAKRQLEIAFPPAKWLRQLVRTHGNVDFSPLQQSTPDEAPTLMVMQEHTKMFTAAAIHFDFEMPALAAWLGSTHTGSHHNPAKLVPLLRKAGVDAGALQECCRISAVGVPKLCQAETTEANFQAHRKHGNHGLTLQDREKTRTALAKDF